MSDGNVEQRNGMGKLAFGSVGRTATVVGALAFVLILLASGGAGATGATAGNGSWGGGGGGTGEYAFASLPGVNSIAVSPSGLFAVSELNCTQVWTVNSTGGVSLYATLPIPKSKCAETPGQITLAPPCWGSNATSSKQWGDGNHQTPQCKCPGQQQYSRDTLATGDGNGNNGQCQCYQQQPHSSSNSLATSDGNSQGGQCQCGQSQYTPHTPSGGADHSQQGGGCGCNHGQQQCLTDTLWDVQEDKLFEISNNGRNVTLFATFPKPGVGMGLTYDSVGSFAHDLIVTGYSGSVYTVNQTGVVTTIANLHRHIQGPAVAPWSFGAYGGDLLVGGPQKNAIFAIEPNGTFSKLTTWASAGSVAFPSGCGCAFGMPPAVMFAANNSSGTIEAFPASYFTSLTGLGFVAGLNNGGLGSFNDTGVTTTLESNTGMLEQITFVQCFGNSGDGGCCGGGQGW